MKRSDFEHELSAMTAAWKMLVLMACVRLHIPLPTLELSPTEAAHILRIAVDNGWREIAAAIQNKRSEQ